MFPQNVNEGNDNSFPQKFFSKNSQPFLVVQAGGMTQENLYIKKQIYIGNITLTLWPFAPPDSHFTLECVDLKIPFSCSSILVLDINTDFNTTV